MSGISTHVLDTSLGRPAAGVPISLERNDGNLWRELSTESTDNDGRVRQMLPADKVLQEGQYRLTFYTKGYFDLQGARSLYPIVQVTFTVFDPDGHYHIPLLMAANGYSTYRGS